MFKLARLRDAVAGLLVFFVFAAAGCVETTGSNVAPLAADGLLLSSDSEDIRVRFAGSSDKGFDVTFEARTDSDWQQGGLLAKGQVWTV